MACIIASVRMTPSLKDILQLSSLADLCMGKRPPKLTSPCFKAFFSIELAAPFRKNTTIAVYQTVPKLAIDLTSKFSIRQGENQMS